MHTRYTSTVAWDGPTGGGSSEVATTISGGGAAFSFALGGALTRRLVLYAEFLLTSVSNPTIKEGLMTTPLETITFFGIGPGVTYYLEPSNFYFSGTVTISRLSGRQEDLSSATTDDVDLTDAGLGLVLTVGKEWWVSPNWGLGVAGRLHAASMKMKETGTRMEAQSLSVLFSATFN